VAPSRDGKRAGIALALAPPPPPSPFDAKPRFSLPHPHGVAGRRSGHRRDPRCSAVKLVKLLSMLQI
jgi:hypothetical protein